MNQTIFEWVRVLGPLLLSWPVVGLVIAFIFRNPLLLFFERFSTSDESKAEIGPIKIELRNLAREGHDAIASLNRLNILMAETRLLELEITEGMFGSVFTDDQRARMKGQIEELRQLTDATHGKTEDGT